MDILRNKKGRECDKQRASTATYDSMKIHHTETYKIGHRWDTTEENQHREHMETNTEQASDKDKCNKYNTKQKDKEYGRKQKWKDSASGTRTKR